MKLIYSNKQLVDYFVGNNSLLDGTIKRIEIFSVESSVCINIDFKMRRSSSYEIVQFRFLDCKSYIFTYFDNCYFYDVENIKFFQNKEGLFYISFDPYDENNTASDEDQDCILCKEVIAYSED